MSGFQNFITFINDDPFSLHYFEDFQFEVDYNDNVQIHVFIRCDSVSIFIAVEGDSEHLRELYPNDEYTECGVDETVETDYITFREYSYEYNKNIICDILSCKTDREFMNRFFAKYYNSFVNV